MGDREILIARQPIYNRNLECVAYELLYRCPESVAEANSNANHATAQVILNAFVEMGLHEVLGNQRAFVNFTRDLLLMDVSQVLPPEIAAIEVLENITPDEDLIQSLRARVEQGYTIVLADFHYRDELTPLLELAHIVKLDVRHLGLHGLRQHIDLLRRFQLKILAEKVETFEEFHFCKDLGCEYFQGYFLSKPLLIRGERMPPNRLATLRLLARLQDPNVDLRELEALVRQDVTLSFALLRSVNSARYPRRTRVESIGQAIVLLGLEYVRNWASLAVLSRLGEKPREMLTTANVRARMCKRLGSALNEGGSEAFFTVGLFSVVDALMDRSMTELVELLPFEGNVSGALLGEDNLMGRVLKTVVAYEQGQWGGQYGLRLKENDLRRSYLDAVRAAVEFDSNFQNARE